MNTIPHCQRCGTHIPPSEAVPYLDSYGHPIPGQYRNWCIAHWAARIGALPPDHPDFFKPLDPRTRRKDNRYLNTQVGYAAMHGRSTVSVIARSSQPSPDPKVEKPAIPSHGNVSAFIAKLKGQVSLFPEFEQLGAWLSKHTPEQLTEMWADLEGK